MFAVTFAALLAAAPPTQEAEVGDASTAVETESAAGMEPQLEPQAEPGTQAGVVTSVEGPEPASAQGGDPGTDAPIAKQRRASLGSEGESPRRADDPYLPAIQIDVLAGPTFCFGGGPARGRCNPVGSGRGIPGLGLSATAGARINRYVLVGAAFTLGNRTAGLTPEGNLAFSGIQHIGIHALARGILPAGRHDFSLGLGIGYGSLSLDSPAQASVSALSANALSLRPSIGWDIWVVTDFSLGLRATALVNFYTQFCADSECAFGDLAPVPSPVRDVFTHAFIIGVELSGLLVLW